MQIIHKANKGIMKVLGEGKVNHTEYRLSTYVLEATTDDGALLHNVVTGELIHLNSDEMKQLSALPCEYDSWMDELIKKHFIVRTQADDKKNVDALRNVVHLLEKKKSVTGYTILPTTNCNARCFYCYEHGTALINMSDETADKLVNFIEEHHGDGKVHLSWFGGEPLVGKNQIDRICNALKNKDIEFSSSMISNGYLFDEALAEHAKESWNLTNIQITLDGTENVYNETKAYVNPCDSPYKKVLWNVKYLMDREIRVNIRLNIGTHNADDLMELVRELAEYYEDTSYLGVYSHILFDNCGSEPVHFDDADLCLLEGKKQELDALIKKLGLSRTKKNLPVLKAHQCMADSDSSLLVLPSGMLGKCEHYTDSHYVGSLDTGVTSADEVKLFKETVDFPQCEDCSLYPSCIKLKLCENNTCPSVEVREKIAAAKEVMLFHYEKFLRGGETESESEEAEEADVAGEAGC